MQKKYAILVLSLWFVSNVVLFQNCRPQDASLGANSMEEQRPLTGGSPALPNAPLPQPTLTYTKKVELLKLAGTPASTTKQIKGTLKMSSASTPNSSTISGVNLMGSSCSGCGPEATEAFYLFKEVLSSALKADSVPIVIENVVNFGLKDLEDSKPLFVRWISGSNVITAKITSFKASLAPNPQNPFEPPIMDSCFESSAGYRFHVCKNSRQVRWGEALTTDVASVFKMKTIDEQSKKNLYLNFQRFTKDASGYKKGTYFGSLAVWENIGLPDEAGRYSIYLKNGSVNAIEVNAAKAVLKSDVSRSLTAKMDVLGEELMNFNLGAGSARISEGSSPSKSYHWDASLQQGEGINTSPHAAVEEYTDYRGHARSLAADMTKLSTAPQCPQQSQVWDCSGDDFLDLDPLIDAGIEVPFINSIRSAINEDL